MAARRQVRRAVTVAAPPDAVWHALVDEDLAAQWLGASDAPPGPAAWQGGAREPGGTTWTREVVSVAQGQRLVYWWWPDTGDVPAVGDVSVVEIELDRHGAGTLVTVTETALADHDDLPAGPDGNTLPVALRAGSGT